MPAIEEIPSGVWPISQPAQRKIIRHRGMLQDLSSSFNSYREPPNDFELRVPYRVLREAQRSVVRPPEGHRDGELDWTVRPGSAARRDPV
jgi:hypothetical protein